MSATGLKKMLGVALVVVAATLAATLLVGSGTVWRAFVSGADPADALTVAPAVPEDLGDLVTWGADGPIVRPVEPQTRLLVESTLVRGWHQVDVALRSGDRSGIETWFLGPIVDRIAADTTVPTTATQAGHHATVTFYSLDGSVMGLDVVSELDREDQQGLVLRNEERYEVVMRLSDGNWRIQHLRRTAIEES